jgi:biopolymer transport protein ExbD
MSKPRKRRKVEEVKPDMTPMIDVTFLLLVFFIVTLKFKVLEGRLDAALPKDRGTSTAPAEEIEKIDILMFVAEPGTLEPERDEKGREIPGLKLFSGREIRLEVGAKKFYYDPINDFPEDLRAFLKAGLSSGVYDKAETPVSIDARKGVVYGDVIKVLDVVIEEQFEKVSFAGTHEQD